MIDAIEKTECRIYVACLAAYNSGRLHGAWIDMEGKDSDAVFAEIGDMLAASPFPNVQRRKCPDCGLYQTDARPYAENSDNCSNCGEDLEGVEFKPSAEEWAVHDHEGFAGMIKSEWPDIGELCELAELLADADEDGRRGLLWLVNDRGASVSEALEQAGDVRTSEGRPADYAAELFEECYSEQLEAMPDVLRFHIDWEGVARDMLIGGDIAETEQAGERFLVTNANEF